MSKPIGTERELLEKILAKLRELDEETLAELRRLGLGEEEVKRLLAEAILEGRKADGEGT